MLSSGGQPGLEASKHDSGRATRGPSLDSNLAIIIQVYIHVNPLQEINLKDNLKAADTEPRCILWHRR